MRRTPRVRAVTLAIGVLLATPGLAVAEPASPDTLGELVAAVANTWLLGHSDGRARFR